MKTTFRPNFGRFGSHYSIGSSPSSGPQFQKGTLETQASSVDTGLGAKIQTAESNNVLHKFKFAFEHKDDVDNSGEVPTSSEQFRPPNIYRRAMLSPYEVVPPMTVSSYRQPSSYFTPPNAYLGAGSRPTRSFHRNGKPAPKAYYKINNNHTIQVSDTLR